MSVCERIRERVAAALREVGIDPALGVLCAVSGGCDSIVLLHAVKAAGFRTGAAHFDHHTRNGESAADAQFVCQLAVNQRVAFVGGGWDAAESELPGGNFEEAARQARYAFLYEAAQNRDFAAVATGHHADDQAETVLMRLLRGTGLHGVEGIHGSRCDGPIPVVRPLLACMREELEAYAKEAGLEWRTDATNADMGFRRNRIRSELLPHLREAYNPQIGLVLSRTAEVAGAENAYMEAQTRALGKAVVVRPGFLLREPFRQAPLALQRRLLAQLCREHGIEPAFERIDEAVAFLLEGAVGRACGLGGGFLLRHAKGGTEVVGPGEAALDAAAPVALPVPGEARAMNRHFLACLLPEAPEEPMNVFCNASRQVFDAAKVGDCLSIRAWKPGDRIEALGLEGSKKLKKIFGEQGVAQSKRPHVPLLAGKEGIAWVVGGPVADWAAVSPETQRYALVEVRDAPR